MSMPAINHAVPTGHCVALHSIRYFTPTHARLHGSDANMKRLPCISDERVSGKIQSSDEV
jgi:hypothetical protein